MKVPCFPKPENPLAWKNPHSRTLQLSAVVPFFKSKAGEYVHRVRSASLLYWDDEFRHTTIHYWCGGMGYANDHKGRRTGEFFAESPENAIMCATCEGRAIGSGQAGAHVINGRSVKFSPRL